MPGQKRCTVCGVVRPLAAFPLRKRGTCSCVQMSDEEALARATAVFTGTLVDYRPPPTGDTVSSMDPATWVFHVQEVHKGRVEQPRQEVTSAVSSASCGLEPPEGQRTYRVYAEPGGQGGILTASLCGGTHLVADQAVPEELGPPTPDGDGELRVSSQRGGVMLAVGAGAGLTAVAGFAGLVWWRRRT